MFKLQEQTASRKQFLIFLCLSSFLVGGVALALLHLALTFPDFSGEPHLSDAQLIANFQQHRAEFEELREMIVTDKVFTRIDVDWTDPKEEEVVGITPSRIDRYRAIFKRLGIFRGWSAKPDRTEITFTTSAQGWVAHGSSKGYQYLAQKPTKLIDNLDTLSGKEPARGNGVRHIEGNWYLYFEGD